jgi:3-hydroxyacyl-CoA dehydrogenase
LIGHAGVVGAGTMGAGIATTFADAGIAVALIDVSEQALERGRATIARVYDSAVGKGKIDADERARRTALIATGASYDALAQADVVVEAVFEDLALKRDVFAALGRACRGDAILATNTSTLDVDAIAAAAPRPERSLGMHFFSPAHVMRLLEIVRGSATSGATVSAAVALGARLGKVPVVVGNCDGFVGNRMLHRYRREAELLLEAGATPEQVDGALRAFGFAMGPFAVADLAGVDIGWRAQQERLKKGPSPFRLSNVPDLLVAAGRLGQKTGAGYYRYEHGDRTPIPDPDVDALVAGERARLGIAPRAVSDDEIVARCVYALVNEGARILDEGIAANAADVDTIWLTGYGFPKARGGPMTYAREVGYGRILAAIRAFARDDPGFWRPARGLEAAAAGDGTIAP